MTYQSFKVRDVLDLPVTEPEEGEKAEGEQPGDSEGQNASDRSTEQIEVISSIAATMLLQAIHIPIYLTNCAPSSVTACCAPELLNYITLYQIENQGGAISVQGSGDGRQKEDLSKFTVLPAWKLCISPRGQALLIQNDVIGLYALKVCFTSCLME